jgi:glucokinase
MTINNDTSNVLAIGMEIGGTKIQVGVGTKDGKILYSPVRRSVIREHGAPGIRRDLISMVDEALISSGRALSEITMIGIGFGGPLDTYQGLALKSYQIEGWQNFPLKKWAEEQWGRQVVVENDASTAGLAEALHGSGCGYRRVFYMTIGSGIGGGWIVDGGIDHGQGLGSAEIGHTWIPDPENGMPVELEHVCSGWGIGRRARLVAEKKKSIMPGLAGSLEAIDARIVYAAAEKGDQAANQILQETCQGLAIAISNVIALLHPERVVIGGGVSFMGDLFWNSLRSEVTKQSMPLFASRVELVAAALGENVVIVGALCL